MGVGCQFALLPTSIGLAFGGEFIVRPAETKADKNY